MMDKIFFNPKSIAVIGASSDKKKLGFLIYDNLRSFGYEGKIFPVNKKKEKIFGSETYSSVLDIDEEVTLAVIVVPAKVEVEVCKECAQKNIKGVVIISSGFSESGKEGKEKEKELKKISKESGIRIIGPNCLGVIDSYSSLDASFASLKPKKSNISVFSQSGAVCSAILDWADKNNKGFSKFVSLGNKADVEESEVLETLAKDKNTKVILGYLESIANGEKFLESAKKVTTQKPVIIVKSGKTKKGAKAVSSHTGNIAGSDLACDVAFREAGIIRAESLEELFNYAKIFQPEWKIGGKNIAIVTNAGGLGVMATDSIEQSVLSLASLQDKTKNKLKKILSKASSVANPVDVLGDANSLRYKEALEIMMTDGNVDAGIVVLTPQLLTEPRKTAQAIIYMARKIKKPIVASFVGGTKIKEAKKILIDYNIPFFDFPSEAVDALEKLYNFNFQKMRKPEKKKMVNYKKKKAGEIIAGYKDKKIITEGKEGALDVLDCYKVKTAERSYAESLTDAAEAAKKIGFPLVLKSAAPNILHKTDVGGVETNIQNVEEFDKSYKKIVKNIEKQDRENSKKVCIYEMKKGEQVFLGAKRDPVFGPMIIFGTGGIHVELIGDFSYRLAPVSKKEAHLIIEETKMGQILAGIRSGEELAKDKVAEIIVNLSNLVCDFPEISEIDMNPVIVGRDQSTAVDAKIILD